MKTVTAQDAPMQFPELLDDVRRGEEVTITDEGNPVAVLHAVKPRHPFDGNAALAEIRRLRRDLSLGGLTIREMIEEGRRY